MSFTWIPFYEQLADKLVTWRDRQPELLTVLRELAGKGLPMVSMDDKIGGATRTLGELDPFTLYASFNRNVRVENRQAILKHLKEYFGIDADVPSDFDGIPAWHVVLGSRSLGRG